MISPLLREVLKRRYAKEVIGPPFFIKPVKTMSRKQQLETAQTKIALVDYMKSFLLRIGDQIYVNNYTGKDTIFVRIPPNEQGIIGVVTSAGTKFLAHINFCYIQVSVQAKPETDYNAYLGGLTCMDCKSSFEYTDIQMSDDQGHDVYGARAYSHEHCPKCGSEHFIDSTALGNHTAKHLFMRKFIADETDQKV